MYFYSEDHRFCSPSPTVKCFKKGWGKACFRSEVWFSTFIIYLSLFPFTHLQDAAVKWFWQVPGHVSILGRQSHSERQIWWGLCYPSVLFILSYLCNCFSKIPFLSSQAWCSALFVLAIRFLMSSSRWWLRRHVAWFLLIFWIIPSHI